MSKKQAACVQCNKTFSHTSDLPLQYCSWSCEWGADAEQYYQWEDLAKEVKGTWVPENEEILHDRPHKEVGRARAAKVHRVLKEKENEE